MAPIKISRPKNVGGHSAIIACNLIADEELLLVVTTGTWILRMATIS